MRGRAMHRAVALALLAAAAGTQLLAGASGMSPALAQEGSINSAIDETPSPAAVAPGAPPGAAGGLKEAYPVTDEAVSAVRIILGRPLPGETCRDALFEARPLLRTRHEAAAGDRLAVPLDELCLVEFRNDAQDRVLELRVGEDLATLAITADQRLFRGLALVPNQTTTIPIRQLPVGQLSVPVDVFWSGATSPGEVQSFTISFVDK